MGTVGNIKHVKVKSQRKPIFPTPWGFCQLLVLVFGVTRLPKPKLLDDSAGHPDTVLKRPLRANPTTSPLACNRQNPARTILARIKRCERGENFCTFSTFPRRSPVAAAAPTFMWVPPSDSGPVADVESDPFDSGTGLWENFRDFIFLVQPSCLLRYPSAQLIRPSPGAAHAAFRGSVGTGAEVENPTSAQRPCTLGSVSTDAPINHVNAEAGPERSVISESPFNWGTGLGVILMEFNLFACQLELTLCPPLNMKISLVADGSAYTPIAASLLCGGLI
ncbi:hypothetical protein B0H16DRAFT_1460621 [Mycena metata]|uniref:Uncharacterized protein n=1 Tax=Mycena metata TaxID=1033252 RepID=A0AAD7IUB4_9AGAR|nr:hypothetical protein B0H16DRAFT_1460621 [Mycena metata]